MTHDWENLIKRYAGDKKICNCGQAYYSMTGEAWLYKDNGERMEKLFNRPVCQYGCQSNKYSVKEYIATRVLEELNGIDVPQAKAPQTPTAQADTEKEAAVHKNPTQYAEDGPEKYKIMQEAVNSQFGIPNPILNKRNRSQIVPQETQPPQDLQTP